MSLESELSLHIKTFFSPSFADKVTTDLLDPNKKTNIESILQMDKEKFMDWYFKKVPGKENPALFATYMSEELAGGLPITADHGGNTMTMGDVITELQKLRLEKEFENAANRKR